MANQILNKEERRKIRSGLYEEEDNQSINYKDKKISYFSSCVKGKKVLDIGSIDHFGETGKVNIGCLKLL